MTLSRVLQRKESQAQKLYAATKNTSLVPPKTYVNSAMQGLYTGNSMASVRDGADNNLLHASLPMGAQIVRAV